MKSARRRWWASFALLAAAGLAWALATPIFAAPDENAHVIRAAAAGRGELLGGTAPPQYLVPPFGDASVSVRAPGIYQSSASVTCFAFHSGRPASCFHLHGPDHPIELVTWVGHHPPAYYVGIGFLSRWVTPGEAQVLAMRALGALLIAALLASSLATLGLLVAPMWAGVGFAVALSPMVFFLSGVVSPSGVEVGAAIGVWVHGAALAIGARRADALDRDAESDAREPVDSRVVDRLGIAACILVLSRALSPVWLVVIGAVLLLLTQRARLRDLLHPRRLWAWTGAVGACVAVQAWWFVYADPLGHFVGTPVHQPAATLLRTSFGKTPQIVREMIGVFGWLDTRPPTITFYVWILAIGALVALAVAFATSRFIRALLAAAAVAIFVPVIVEAAGASKAGYIWQGRYSLPLAVGVPLLAGIGIGSTDALAAVRRRLPRVLVVGLWIAQVGAFTQALRRYAVGAHGSLWFFSSAAWEPPVPAIVLVVGYAVVMGAALWWIVLSPRGPETGIEPDIEPDIGPVATVAAP